jgi:capsule biosynthesis phosphatase
MNIIIPIGGIGRRFYDDNYQIPKPLIKSLGESIIVRCIGSLNIDKNTDIIYIPYIIELDEFNFQDNIKHVFNDYNFKFIPIEFKTRGASETVLFALDLIEDYRLNDLTIIIDSDNVFNEDIISEAKKINNNLIFYFKDTQKNPLFSYIEIKDNYVFEIQEKVKISDNACCGVYCFKNSLLLKNYIIDVIKNNNKTKNEFYISTLYKNMLNDNILITHKEIKNFNCLGTPEQLKMNSTNLSTVKKMRFCFDLDNTLVTYPTIKGDYSTVNPIIKNINFLKSLKKQGHHIIIYTARRMKTHSGNLGAVICDIGEITLKTLKNFEIPYDEIYFGKPYADYYIDDLSVNPINDLEKELGFYNIHPETRSHNKIEIIGDKIKKFSKNIEGEKFWYMNIPENIKEYFPSILEYDDDSITISKIYGIPICHLYTNLTLNEDILTLVLKKISLIHNSNKDIDYNINIDENYSGKIKNRFMGFDHSNLKDFDKKIEHLTIFFEDYIKNEKYRLGVIHGDPVFTNILIDNFDNLKFIDMRGKVGKKLSIYGDIFYDFAKIYQSIIGYDFVLLDRNINTNYIEENKKIFFNYITNNYGVEYIDIIKNITLSLIITLLPIHNNKIEKFYNLIENI